MMSEPSIETLPTNPLPRRWRWGPLAGFVVALLLMLGIVYSGVLDPFWEKTIGRAIDQRQYLELRSMYDEMQQWKADGLTESEWNQRASLLLPRLKVISDRLKQTANRYKPAQQHLLWAARDRFPQVLAAGPSGFPYAEEELRYQLDQAGVLLDAP